MSLLIKRILVYKVFQYTRMNIFLPTHSQSFGATKIVCSDNTIKYCAIFIKPVWYRENYACSLHSLGNSKYLLTYNVQIMVSWTVQYVKIASVHDWQWVEVCARNWLPVGKRRFMDERRLSSPHAVMWGGRKGGAMPLPRIIIRRQIYVCNTTWEIERTIY